MAVCYYTISKIMNRKLKRLGIWIALLAILSGAGLFLSRGVLLRHVADKRIAAWSARYDIGITYASLRMPSLSAVRVEGLSVVPARRDTLLRLASAEVKIDFFSLLRGDISIREVDTEGLECTFMKQGAVSNYDFLFRSSEKKRAASDAGASLGYADRIDRALGLLFRLLPEDAVMRRTVLIGERDSLRTRFYMPELVLDNRVYVSDIEVTEGDMRGEWHVEGALDCGMRSVKGSLASAERGKRVVMPYVRPHYGAAVAFDSIAFSLAQMKPEGGCQLLKGHAEVSGLEVHHAALSPDTIDLNRGKIDYALRAGERFVELDSASMVCFNRLSFHPFVRAEKEGRWHFTASIHRPPFPAQDLFASLPAGLFRHLQGIQVSGELSYDLRADIDFNRLDSLEFSSDLRGHGFRITRMGTTDLARMSGEFEYTAYEHDQPVRTFSIGPSNPGFRPLSRISPLLQMAILQSEDGNFFYHDGFYPGAIGEALAYDLQKGRFARGGSSITMQLVKNVFLNRHKNIARKLEEALIVWLIESQRLTSKERMYEVYLNIIEWGPMVYGAAEASRFYFEKEPADLSVSEAIFLASIIPKPKHFRSVFNPDATLRENQLEYYRVIARRLAAKGLMTEEEAETFRPDVQVKGEARRALKIEN